MGAFGQSQTVSVAYPLAVKRPLVLNKLAAQPTEPDAAKQQAPPVGRAWHGNRLLTT
jgi:hypothetical protein